MDITSFSYIAFVGISLLLYWIVPKKAQWIVLLVDNIIFYFANARAYTIVYLIVSVVSVWGATLLFERIESEKTKKAILVCTILLNVGILAVLKYTNLFINTFNYFSEKAGGVYIVPVRWAASLAISFYTLQILAYLLDSYWGVSRTEKNVLKLFLFTSFFPIMVCGPINSFEKLGVSLFEEHRFEYTRVTHGMKRIAWGMLKKLAISNRLGVIVDTLWKNPSVYHGIWIWIAASGYAFQLYTDFSGCMDIVLGVCECFGIEVAENFKAPLLSRNIQEFWRRWHITLGQWLRDYIMNPLLKSEGMLKLGDWSKKKFGKKKGKKLPVYLSMLVLWSAMGLWHGNSWKYIVGEGLWYWLVIVLSQMLEGSFKKAKEKLHIKEGFLWQTWQVIRTNMIFAVGMLFFRADTMPDALHRIAISVDLSGNFAIFSHALQETLHPLHTYGVIIMVIAFAAMFAYDLFLYKDVDVIACIGRKPAVVRWAIYIVICLAIMASYNVGSASFAYAQF